MRRRERERDVAVTLDDGGSGQRTIDDAVVEILGLPVPGTQADEPADGRLVRLIVDDPDEHGLLIIGIPERALRRALGPDPEEAPDA